jgi:hypothetical protein
MVMHEKIQISQVANIQNHILTIRGVQVMLDRDLAEIYGVETRRLNEQVKRNPERFPDQFMFQLTKEEMEIWKSQFATSNKVKMGFRKPPLVFTEQGVSMLSAVLKSKTAVKVSIQIIQAFVEMKKFISTNAAIFQRLDKVELKQIKTDEKVDTIFKALEDKSIKHKQGIFYNGQIFDAYVFASGLIKSAKRSILLIDNYIDESVLNLLTKRNENVAVIIYTKRITKTLEQDLEKHNCQYQKIEIKEFSKAHDRFLIIDEATVYHFGASLKDLGKKWFAFSKMEIKAMEMISNLKTGIGDE